ncbi:WcaI family glycosyltransferase [Pseudonocardia endophytica]|uniref:Glycosyltransferase involved in cell wall biosynthesis n=1 Tax=Pseudonocardia endophytica TaxID=401976 RepID=A0A4R1HK95_PSEEN|nr:WcaI family glycosyltransferase [Pseudonocardia endophytica]TCK20935.1 glycosyltransferase involved in cell wall biosynthesis [Pseudonocardia endophytica]
MLRVVVLGLNYQPEEAGIAPYTSGMARFLADAGHDVHVITSHPHYPAWKVADGYGGRRMEETDGRIRVTRLWHPVPSNPGGRSRVVAEAVFSAHASLVRSPKPDVVVAVSPALLTVGAALLRRYCARARLGVVVQDFYGRAIAETGVLGGRGARLVSGLERSLLTRADGLVAIHDTFERSLVELGADRNRISVIRNWTHTQPASGDPGELRRRLGWGPDDIVALHAGNMGAKQGLENVVDAARLADERGSHLRFVLLGDGNQRKDLERHAAGLERVSFVDPLPGRDFETALEAADVLVLNERPEVVEMCVPSKLTSYFAAGRPVIAATSPRSASATEITASGGGRCVAAGDPAALLEGSETLAGDESGARAMGERGRRYAQQVLTEDAARSAYVQWVEELAAGSVDRRGKAA